MHLGSYQMACQAEKEVRTSLLKLVECSGVVKEKGGMFWNVFSYSNLVHAVAGAVGSAVAMTVFYPLDTARTRLQVDDKRQAKHSPVMMLEIAREEGILSLYRGLYPVVSTLWCSNFVYFYTYNSLKAVVLGDLGKQDPAKDLLLAFISGVINVLVTTPLWVVNTRLKLQGVQFKTKDFRERNTAKYSGILDALVKITKRDGLSALWNGTKPSIVLASNPAIQFMVYEAIKRYFQRRFGTEELSGLLYFLIGAVAKTVATILTYPIQVLQSRLRAGLSKEHKEGNMYQAFTSILRSQGWSGLYKGMEAKLIQTVSTAALMFVIYEEIAAFIFKLMGHDTTSMKR